MGHLIQYNKVTRLREKQPEELKEMKVRNLL